MSQNMINDDFVGTWAELERCQNFLGISVNICECVGQE